MSGDDIIFKKLKFSLVSIYFSIPAPKATVINSVGQLPKKVPIIPLPVRSRVCVLALVQKGLRQLLYYL